MPKENGGFRVDVFGDDRPAIGVGLIFMLSITAGSEALDNAGTGGLFCHPYGSYRDKK